MDYNSRVAEIDNKVSSLDDKDAEKKTTKNVSIENELKGLVKDLAFFLWTNALFDGWDAASQACLILQPIHRYVKIINIHFWMEI